MTLGYDCLDIKLIFFCFDSCIEKSLCNDRRDAEGITPFASGSETLLALIDTAQKATCPEENHICCNINYINNNVIEEGQKLVSNSVLNQILIKPVITTTTTTPATTTHDDYYDTPDECSKFFRESASDFTQFGYNKTTIEEKLIYV